MPDTVVSTVDFVQITYSFVKLPRQRRLHKKLSFPLRISSVNVTKSACPADLVSFTEEILNGKLIFVHGKDAVLSLFNFVFTLAKLRVHTYLTES